MHEKHCFTDDIPVERLLGRLDVEVKWTLIAISRNGLFYAAAMKMNTMVVSFLKLKSVIDLPQISVKNHGLLRIFYQQLKSVIMCLNSIGLYFYNKFDRKHNKDNY